MVKCPYVSFMYKYVKDSNLKENALKIIYEQAERVQKQPNPRKEEEKRQLTKDNAHCRHGRVCDVMRTNDSACYRVTDCDL